MSEQKTSELVSFRQIAKQTLVILKLILLALDVIKRVLDLL